MEAPSLPSTSGTSVHRLTVYGNRPASISRRSGVSLASLQGLFAFPCPFTLLATFGEPCWPLTPHSYQKRGGGGRKETPEP